MPKNTVTTTEMVVPGLQIIEEASGLILTVSEVRFVSADGLVNRIATPLDDPNRVTVKMASPGTNPIIKSDSLVHLLDNLNDPDGVYTLSRAQPAEVFTSAKALPQAASGTLNVSHGEDAIPISERFTVGGKTYTVLAVADGLGGSGARKRVRSGLGVTEAKIGSETVRATVLALIAKWRVSGMPANPQAEIEQALAQSFSPLDAAYPLVGSNLGGTVFNHAFPTTLSMSLIEETAAGSKVTMLWAGDSPMGVFTPQGTYSTYVPGTGDDPMTETISSTTHTLHVATFTIAKGVPYIVTTTSDGLTKVTDEFKGFKAMLQAALTDPSGDIQAVLQKQYLKNLIELDDVTYAISANGDAVGLAKVFAVTTTQQMTPGQVVDIKAPAAQPVIGQIKELTKGQVIVDRDTGDEYTIVSSDNATDTSLTLWKKTGGSMNTTAETSKIVDALNNEGGAWFIEEPIPNSANVAVGSLTELKTLISSMISFGLETKGVLKPFIDTSEKANVTEGEVQVKIQALRQKLLSKKNGILKGMTPAGLTDPNQIILYQSFLRALIKTQPALGVLLGINEALPEVAALLPQVQALGADASIAAQAAQNVIRDNPKKFSDWSTLWKAEVEWLKNVGSTTAPVDNTKEGLHRSVLQAGIQKISGSIKGIYTHLSGESVPPTFPSGKKLDNTITESTLEQTLIEEAMVVYRAKS